MNKILEIKNLYKSYDNVNVLNDISFNINEGEFVAIMGPSGSGKSTLLYNISGMDKPNAGEIILKGENISKLKDEEISDVRLKNMGFIFQNSYLLKNLSIRDNIVLPGFKAEKFTREEVNQKADELMKKTGIDHIANNDIKKVSGGQLQRAAICRSLINNPDIIFGDEPTGALNSSTSKEVADIINKINEEGTTIIIVTHDAKIALRASRVIYLMDGKIFDELDLGMYKSAVNLVNREKKLRDWLQSLGF